MKLYTVTVTLVQVGADLQGNVAWLSLNDAVLKLLKLQRASDYNLHPNLMFINCFNMLICSGSAYGCTLTL